MNNILPYYFTVYGEVYTGEELSDPNFPEYKILIQRDKIREFQAVKNKTPDTIGNFGCALPNCTISDCKRLDFNHYFQRQNSQRPDWNQKYDRRIMFILGAGASANCVTGSSKPAFEKSGSRPPLGIQLFKTDFEGFYRKYPGVIHSLHNLQGDHAIDVETLFENEWQEIFRYANKGLLARHINIQYYLQELMHHISYATLTGFGSENLYARLSDKLQQWHTRNPKRKLAFVSFNYDTILDLFLSRYFNVQFNSMDDYIKINEGPVSVFKPHGSWNWGWKFYNQQDRSITMAEWLFKEKIDLHTIYYQLLGNYEEMLD